jgi:hypothetical protein
VLGLNEWLCLAALDHVKDQGPKGITGHEGADGSTIAVRGAEAWSVTWTEVVRGLKLCGLRFVPGPIQRHCQWSGVYGENIDYGVGGWRHAASCSCDVASIVCLKSSRR